MGGPHGRNMAGPRGVIPPPGVGMGGAPDKWQQSGPPPQMAGQGDAQSKNRMCTIPTAFTSDLGL